MLRAILGGSFDPVHLGHVAMARHLLDNELADSLMIIPAWRSPHKSGNSATPADRLAMARLALGDWDRVQVDDREIIRRQVSYTVDTLEELSRIHPDDKLRLVIGADNLAGFLQWRSPDRIQEIADIVVYPRNGHTPSLDDLAEAGLDPRRVIPVTDFDHPVSSTTVRAMLAGGDLAEDQLPHAVVAYITAHNLYMG
jgi:nicotinate-nucleotide adenylyltransferase